MMKRRLALALLMVGIFSSVEGQVSAPVAKRTLTLSEYTSGSTQYLAPRNLRALQWLDDDRYIYIDDQRDPSGAAAPLMVGYTKAGRQDEVLLSLDELRGLLPAETQLKRFPSVVVIPGESPLLEVRIAGHYYTIDPDTKTLRSTTTYPEGMVAHAHNPSRSHIAVVREHNISIVPLRTREAPIQITQDGSATIVYGQSVHQNEFGIHGGLFWSPDGTKLAFYRMDQSMVEPYPILHVSARRPYSEMQYYPMAGTPSHQVSLGVYDTQTGQTIYMKTGLPLEKYLTNIAWTPDGKGILIAEVNREQTDCTLNMYDATSGELVRTILSEHSDIYTEPQHPAQFVPGNPRQFVWQSRRDGFMHLYLYDLGGKQIRQLTRGEWEVTNLLGFSADGRTLYYQSTTQSPLDRHVYALSLASGARPQLLTPGAGWHSAKMNAKGTFLLDTHESISVPLKITLRRAKGGVEQASLLEASNPEEGYLTPQIELGKIKAADDKTELHYRLIRPYDFDPSRSYPAIIYVYNGPHVQLVQNRFRSAARGWELNMANLGYIILTVDGRGSAYRGSAFEQVIHRQVGTHEMADQMRGVELLRSLGYVDMQRLGVYGWSYGGFMTTNLMLTHSDTFKVGVAGGPVMDWSRYEIMYGERYMDSPQDNPEGYKANNLLLRAGDLKGRLLLIHGTIDPVVIWQHSLLFVQAAVKAGTHPDYMVYPEHPHNVIGPDRVHLNEVITRYFQDHL